MPLMLGLLQLQMLDGCVGMLESIMVCYGSLQYARCSTHLTFRNATCIPQITSELHCDECHVTL